jgi:hypothetical protein
VNVKVLYFLLKTGLCLSLPLGFSLAATLIAPSSVQAQTNQSDITGPAPNNTTTTINNNATVIKTVITVEGSAGGGTTIVTNQSDITGGTINTGTTIIREITVSITRILLDPNMSALAPFITGTPGGGNASSAPVAPTPAPVSSPEPAPVIETTVPESTSPLPLPTAQGSEAQQSVPVSTNQSDSTGNISTEVPSPVAVDTQNPAIQAVELALGPQRFVMLIPPGNRGIRGNAFGTLVALANSGNVRLLNRWTWGSWGGMLLRIGNQRVFISLAGISPGSSEHNPVLPDGMEDGAFTFIGVVTDAWTDPPVAEGFRYKMTSDSLFTEIQDFPTGFPNPFTVSVNGQELGEFGPGDSVDFTQFPGGGVKEFTVTGLTPLVDPENPIAFPLKLGFNTETADFTMAAILDPDAVAYYEENPLGPEPFTFNIMSHGSTMEIAPSSTGEVLRENADRIAQGIDNLSQRQQFLTTVASVETDLNHLSSTFQTLLPVGGGLNTTGLNPSMNSVAKLRNSLPMLLEQLGNLSDDASESETLAIAQMVNEVEGMTTLLEALTPMLSQVRESLAISQ